MINKKKADKIPVSIVIPMRNSETTIIETLSSLNKQNHPIREIYIIDNVSKDNSIKLVNDFRNKNKKIPIFILINKHNLGVGGSYNKGVKKAKSPLIVLMHSDSSLTSSNELGLLVGPFYRNKNVVATYSTIILPRRIWNTYNFWQKVLSARAVDKKQPGLNGKFDCILRKEFLKIGGFNVKEYGHHMNIGAEDSDLHMRLLKVGEVVKAKSKVLHLHYLGKKYSIKDLFSNRKLLARSYGRLLRMEHINLGIPILLFFIKPVLVLLLFLPFLFPLNFALILIYVFWYYSEMYISDANKDKRILLLPMITFALLVCEVYWMAQSFLFVKRAST